MIETCIPEAGELKVESFSTVRDSERRGERMRRSTTTPAAAPTDAAAAVNVTVSASENEEGRGKSSRRRGRRQHDTTFGFELFGGCDGGGDDGGGDNDGVDINKGESVEDDHISKGDKRPLCM